MTEQTDISKLQGFIVDVKDIHWHDKTMTDADIREEHRKELERMSRKEYKASGEVHLPKFPAPLTPKQFGMKILSKRNKRR